MPPNFGEPWSRNGWERLASFCPPPKVCVKVYIVDLIQLVERHGLSPHLYADDVQVYGSCSPAAVDAFSTKISDCADDIADWARSNRLMLNPDKSEAIWCTTSWRQHQTANIPIIGVSITTARSVRDLSIYIDADLSMRAHVDRTVSRCFAALRQLRQIRRAVPTNSHIPDARSSLVHSLLDYCVMQYWSASQPTWCADCSRCSMRRHGSSTTCDRTTTSPMRWQHCTGCASENACSTRSQWWRSKFWTTARHARYLGPLVAVADLPGRRALRSASTSRLVIPPIKLSTVGSRAFLVTAAQVWNGLPEAVISSSSLQSFRRQLKTHLFQISYPHLILWLLVWHRYSGPCSNAVI